MENSKNIIKSKAINSNYKTPLLFTIPLSAYADEIGRERDKESFLKIQELEKKCEQLREKFSSYFLEHSLRLATTKSLICRTISFNNSMKGKIRNVQQY